MAEQIVHKLVAEVMTPYLMTRARYSSLAEAWEIMEKNHIRRLPVVGADGKLVGLITESDIFRTIVNQWRTDNLLFSGAG